MRFVFVSVLLLMLISFNDLFGQDIHYSQFLEAPQVLNPALTAKSDGDFRFISNHRSQWRALGSPLFTNAINFDHILHHHNQEFGIGFSVINDQSGGAPLTVNKILLSISYLGRFGGHRLSFGAQPSLIIKSMDPNSSSFPEQYDRGTGDFNTRLPSGEAGSSFAFSFFDMNLGLHWLYAESDWQPELGFSVFHVNRPNDSFYSFDNPLPLRYIYFGKAQRKLGQEVIQASVFYMHTDRVNDLMIRTDLIHPLENTTITAIQMSLMWRDGFNRNRDAAIAAAGLQVKNWRFMLSYDFNVSDLAEATNLRGATEISIQYLHPSSILKSASIPCDRF